MNIIFLGPPASGKDTQAELLEEKYGFHIISGGEALREEIANGGAHAAVIEEHMQRGELVPSPILFEVVGRYVEEHAAKADIIFTGSARRVEEIGFIDDLLAKLGGKLDAVIYLALPDDESVSRISGRWYSPSSDRTYHEVYKPPKVAGIDDETGEKLIKRIDDQPEVVRERLRIFHDEVKDIKAAYMARGIWHEIDASPSIPEIHEQIVRVLGLQPK